MRIVIADPPAYTPWYDHELAGALARAGADVELATSHFRFAELPPAAGYVRAERFYPLSSRLFRRSRARLPLKAAEHLGVARTLGRVRADVLHLQWLAVPQVDVKINFRSPAVFTAHDLLPRRTADKLELWKRLLAKFDRVVVHTERGREALGELGIEPVVISHPVYPSSAKPDDDGQTVLALGVIRPYKGLADAVEVVTRLTDSRLLVAGDPAMELGDLRDAPRVEWRLGYLTPAELDRALSHATIAIFPYRAELDQSGALLQALGAGVPAVAYDVGGLAEPIANYGAGRVVPAGDVDALTEAVRELLSDAQALAAAREGAERARSELTWDAAAARHLEVYEELGVIFRRNRFADVISRQLDLFERENPYVIEEAVERYDAYNAADRDEAEELFGDYIDAVETGTEILADIRDGYMRTLEEGIDEQYEAAFNRAVAKRLPPFALEIENR